MRRLIEPVAVRVSGSLSLRARSHYAGRNRGAQPPARRARGVGYVACLATAAVGCREVRGGIKKTALIGRSPTAPAEFCSRRGLAAASKSQGGRKTLSAVATPGQWAFVRHIRSDAWERKKLSRFTVLLNSSRVWFPLTKKAAREGGLGRVKEGRNDLARGFPLCLWLTCVYAGARLPPPPR